jgi:Competence protein CoiA-like family
MLSVKVNVNETWLSFALLHSQAKAGMVDSMLVAYGPGGQPIVAEEVSLDVLQLWSREHTLFCPNCRGVVHLRGGPEKRTQLHFAHQRGECAWSTEAESVRHARGKSVLANWLKVQFPQAVITLEKRLPEPNRIADIFVKHQQGACWAIEFQCAPLDVDEWRHRHTAYRNANILDIWIVGNNRREKQEAFIEAVIAFAHEILFLDPLVTPQRAWLRWPVSRETLQLWREGSMLTPALEGWVGRQGRLEQGATIDTQLHTIGLREDGVFVHALRSALAEQTGLLQAMSVATSIDETALLTYLRQRMSGEAVRAVILPLARAYARDPDLLRRYNFGRGTFNQLPREEDALRVQRARNWLNGLAENGYTTEQLQELAQGIPFVGPYGAFASYCEMLLALL